MFEFLIENSNFWLSTELYNRLNPAIIFADMSSVFPIPFILIGDLSKLILDLLIHMYSVLFVIDPSPTCPRLFFPTVHTFPSFLTIVVPSLLTATSIISSTLSPSLLYFSSVASNAFVVFPLLSCPYPLYPQATAVPSFFIAIVVSFPASICFTLLRYFGSFVSSSILSITFPNLFLPFVVLFPRFPYPLYPLEYTCPLESNAIIVLFSTATSTMFSNSITSVGTYRFDVFPFPNCPYPLYPHVYNFPSAVTAVDVWFLPAIFIIPSNFIFIGVAVPDVVPFPNCPFPLYPHVYNFPSFVSAIELYVLPAICDMFSRPGISSGFVVFPLLPN